MGEIMSDNESRLSVGELQTLKPYGDSDTEAMAVARARLVNATPVLLEVVAAARVYRNAKKRAAGTRAQLYRQAFPDGLSAASVAHDQEEIQCRDAFDAALAKVRE